MNHATTPNHRHGYICLWRDITDSVLWSMSDFDFKLFTHLALSANWKTKHWWDAMAGAQIEIPRGSLITSNRNLALALGRDPRFIARSIKRLVAAKRIVKRANRRHTMITICDYDQYTAPDAPESAPPPAPAPAPPTPPATPPAPINHKPLEGKNEKSHPNHTTVAPERAPKPAPPREPERPEEKGDGSMAFLARKEAIYKIVYAHQDIIRSNDPTPLVNFLTSMGYHPLRAWASIIQSRKKDNPAAYLCTILSGPQWAVADSAMTDAKAEMREHNYQWA